ncbi:MAG: carcinine hydrolase/isopenicillin-N N-acyltransferase family protein [bacterium]
MAFKFNIRYAFYCFNLNFAVASACTIGVFTSEVMQEGRPVLWKNRDVTNRDQEMKFLRGRRFRFVANVYAGETLDVWAGINEAGFAIMNSNSYNLTDNIASADDGNTMRLALGICATVEDFARLLDSLNLIGRETPANFGVFDATGAVAIFEAGYTSYTRCDANLDSLRFLLRANYSMSGGPSRLLGKNRYERALQLCRSAYYENRLEIPFIIQTLSRDLGQVAFDPYPLPFLGRFGTLPFGYLPTDTTICRSQTRSVEIMVGPAAGENPYTGMVWVLLGQPIATLPIPIWVAAETVPYYLDGAITSPICDESQKLVAYLHPLPEHPKAVNTFRLTRWLEFIAPVESAIFDLVSQYETNWRPNSPDRDEARTLTDSICRLVLTTYNNFWQTVETEESVLLKPGPKKTVYFKTPSLNSFSIFDITGRAVEPSRAKGVVFLLTDRTKERFIILKR